MGSAKEQSYTLIVMVSHEKLLQSLSKGMVFSIICFEEIALVSVGTVGKQETKEGNNLCEERWQCGIGCWP